MRAQVFGPEKAGPRAGESGATFPLGYLSSSGKRSVSLPGRWRGRGFLGGGASGAGSAGTGRSSSADPPPSCPPFARGPERDRGTC